MKKLKSWNSLELKISALWKNLSKEWEDKFQTGRKYLQKTHVIKDCSPKYKKNSKLKSKKMNNLIQNWTKDLNRHLVKDMQMEDKFMERCSASYVM